MSANWKFTAYTDILILPCIHTIHTNTLPPSIGMELSHHHHHHHRIRIIIILIHSSYSSHHHAYALALAIMGATLLGLGLLCCKWRIHHHRSQHNIRIHSYTHTNSYICIIPYTCMPMWVSASLIKSTNILINFSKCVKKCTFLDSS